MSLYKHLILSLFFLAALPEISASSTLSLSSAQGAPRDTVTVTVSLNTTDAVSAVDITIPLGTNLKYASGSVVLDPSRSNGHQVTASQVGDDLRLVVYSLSLSTLNGQSGTLLTFGLVLGKEPAVYTLTPTVVLGSSTGSTIPSSATDGSVTIVAPKLSLNTTQLDYGHIPIRSTYTRSVTLTNSGTDTLNVSAITFNDPEFSCQQSFAIAAGSSQSVTVTYAPQSHGAATATMSIVSDATNGTQKVNIIADPFSVNELHVLNTSGVSDDTVNVYLKMNNMESIVGVQCSFRMPDALVPVANSFTLSSRSVDHITMTTMSHDTLTLMAYSPLNTPFIGNDDTIGFFQIKLDGSNGNYYLTPFNVVLATASGDNFVSASYRGNVYIQSPRLSVASTVDMDSVSVTETGRTPVRVTNNGQVDLDISRVTFLSEGFSVSNTFPLVIPANMSDTIWVEHHPQTEGAFSTTMQIYSNDPISRLTSVTLHGIGYEPNSLNLRGALTSNGDYDITVGLDNYSDIVAVQMDIHWLDSMTTSLSALSLKSRANGLSPVVSKLTDGTYRVALFSMDNTPVTGHDGDIFSLIYSGDVPFNHTTISVDNIIVSNAAGVNKNTVSSLSWLVALHTVTLSCDTALGSVSGEGIFNHGDTATITATAIPHYHLVSWSNGLTDPTVSFPVVSDTSLSASFAIDQHLMTLSVNDTLMGYTSGAGTYNYGDTITLTATALPHHHFVSWSNGQTSSEISLILLGDSSLTAIFAIDTHSVTVVSDDSLKGSVSGGGIYNYGDTVTLMATPAPHHFFASWSNGAVTTTVSFVLTHDTLFTAYFDLDTHSVTILVNDTLMGSVAGAGSYPYGTTANLTATAVEHYHFVSWNEGQTSPAVSFTVEGDTTLTATFAIDQHTVTAHVNDSLMGSVSGAGTYDYGDTITLTANAFTHYHFVSWSNGQTTPSISVPLFGDSTFTASFAPNQYVITVTVNDAAMGSATGGGTFDYGQTITLSATAAAHHHLVSWSNGQTSPSISVPVLGDSSYTATFAINQHTVTLSANDASMGSVSGAGTYDYGDTVTLTATAFTHYHFVSWSNGQTSPVIMIPLFGDSSLTAVFAPDQYVISVAVNDSSMGSAIGGGIFDYGQTITLTATAAPHYHFVSWDNGDTAQTISVTVLGDSLFTATFAVDVYTLTANANIPEGGAVTGSGSYAYLDTAIVIAYPKYGYVFKGWSNGETTQTIHVVVVCDTTITAQYEEKTSLELTDDDSYVVMTEGRQVAVEGAKTIAIYDAAGRLITSVSSDDTSLQRFDIHTAGIYFVWLDERKCIRILVK